MSLDSDSIVYLDKICCKHNCKQIIVFDLKYRVIEKDGWDLKPL